MELKLDPSALMLGTPLEVKATGVAGQIEGLASVFGEEDSYRDVIRPGAFAKSLAAHAKVGTLPLMLFSHDVARPIGHWDELKETPRGLVARGSLNLKTSAGRDAFEHIKARDVSGLSIGFNVHKGGAEFDQDGRRILKSVELHEISVVALPAAPKARISEVKSAGQIRQFLKDHGINDRAARKMAQGAYAALEGRDLEEIEAEAKASAQNDQLKHVARLMRRTLERM